MRHSQVGANSVVALAIWVGCAQVPAGEMETTLPRLVHIEEGALVGQGPPRGWSHRIIRSVPQLSSGDLDSLPDSARRTATLFRTVIAADVVRHEDGYVLARLGVGNAIPTRNGEVVVTTEGPSYALKTLGTVQKVVLRVAESNLAEGQLIARTPTFALLRTPGTLRVGQRHVEVDLHYAVMVEERSGAVRTLAWAQASGKPESPAEVILLEPDLTFTMPLDARISRRVGPVALSWTFAMDAMPPGRRLAVPAEANSLLRLTGTREADPIALEQTLRTVAGG